MRGKSINDAEIAFETMRQEKLVTYEQERTSKDAFYAYRYNRPAKC